MPWYVPAVLLPWLLLTVYFSIKALMEVERGANRFNLFALGIWARDEHFTPVGRRYRMLALSFVGAGVLLVILFYLVSSHASRWAD